MRIAVLMTCYNRVATTLECLRCLFAARCPADVLFDVWLNDDGATDGTGERCRAFFADKKNGGWQGEGHVLKGSGHDYWCGGMRRAWQSAIDSGMDYDGYLWLNDDTFLNADAFAELLISEEALVVGAISAADGVSDTYGGYDAKGDVVKHNGTVQEVERVNGNVVWVPRKVFEKIGNFDSHWTHALGDGDYSLRVREAGMRILLTANFVGQCERNLKLADWVNPKASFLKRVKNLYSPLGYAEPPLWFRYCHRHYGLFAAIRGWVLQHVRVCLPGIWVKKLGGFRK